MSKSPGGPRLTSMADVAAHAGVSVMTVSNVINRPHVVSETTSERVRSSMRVLNYRNNLVARSLRLAEPRQLGYIVTERDPNLLQYMDEFLLQLAFACQRQQRNLTLVAQTGHHFDLDACEDLYYGQSVAGFVLADIALHDPRPRELFDREVPFVAYGQTVEGVDVPWSWVKSDGAAGIAKAVGHVASLGHSELAFLGQALEKPSSMERRHGYADECERRGFASSLESSRVVTTAEGIAGGRAAALTVLDSAAPPTALICANDSIALGTLSALRRRGISVGVDVAVTGYDNSPFAALDGVGITTVQQPASEIAQTLVRLLTERPAAPQHLLLEPTLLVRETTLP